MLQNVNVTLNTIHSVYLISQPSNHNLLHHTSQNEIVFKPSINNQHWEVSNCQVTDIWSLEKAKQNESSLLTGYEPAGQQCDLLQQLSSLSSESTLSKKKYNHNLLIIILLCKTDHFLTTNKIPLCHKEKETLQPHGIE